jgi:tetratricopeptide (TPR) repeat protein
MAGPAPSPSPDALYANRTQLASARRAADIWADMLTTDPRDVDAAWKLSRACYWLGKRAPEQERRAYLERGVTAGRKAVTLAADRPEGHFWIAANMGALAESFGLLNGLKYRTAIRDELETVLRLDPGFMRGSAERALGRWYFKVPRLFGGSNRKAEQHLRASLTLDPANSVSHFFLAELLLDAGRRAEARMELQAVLDAPADEEWGPETSVYQAKARALLDGLHEARLRRRPHPPDRLP